MLLAESIHFLDLTLSAKQKIPEIWRLAPITINQSLVQLSLSYTRTRNPQLTLGQNIPPFSWQQG
jgi:hypothetical protein